jgi:RNA polymerase sigma-70 factor (ECF subfamily)
MAPGLAPQSFHFDSGAETRGNPKSWSRLTGNKYAAPQDDGPNHFERDRRTCVMPVKLDPGKTYVMGVNSERFRNFKDARGHPALTSLLVFRTKDAAGR